MNKHLLRNKDKYNPYTLEVDETNEIYTVIFKDSNKIEQKVVVNKEVYDAFDKFELEDISQIHKYRKHIEHSEIFEETLYHRAISIPISVEEEVEIKILNNELLNAIKCLNDIQKTRIIKYFFDGKTYDEIASEEGCSKVAVKYSIDNAINNLRIKLNK